METYIMERGYVSPNDAGIMAQTDSRSIQNAVNAALASGLGKVVIPGTTSAPVSAAGMWMRQ